VPVECWPKPCKPRSTPTSASFAAERDEHGRRLVVRNGYHDPREVLTSAGAVQVTVPRVNDQNASIPTPVSGSGSPPRSCRRGPRKTPKITEVLPLAVPARTVPAVTSCPALGQFLGSAKGLVRAGDHQADRAVAGRTAPRSASVICPPWTTCTCGRTAIHVNIRLQEHKLCLLVMIGVARADGRKELIAPGRRVPRIGRVVGGTYCVMPSGAGNARSRAGRRRWRARVLECVTRGLSRHTRATLLVPQDRQRTRGAAEIRAPGRERRRSAEIWKRRRQTTRSGSGKGVRRHLRREVSPRRPPRSPTMSTKLLAFYDYPAEHWIHLRTTNPIESTFATVRHRTKVTKGPGSRGGWAGHGLQAH